MKIFILPGGVTRALIDYQADNDTMWVHASYPPRAYTWHHNGNEIEQEYLKACLAVNQWLRDFETPVLVDEGSVLTFL